MSISVFHSGKPGEAAVADVVFVHGLRGSAVDTWTQDGVCWPRDLLKSDLENIRIMSWAYDASVASLKGSASQASVFGNAETLLSDLSDQRLSHSEKTRPIIFVGHSLGGLVIKEALIRSAQLYKHDETPELGMIYQYTAGVIFMGTPHRGSDKTPFADLLVYAARATWGKPNDELLNSLKSNAGVLNQQRANFTTIMNSFSVVCLYEEKPTFLLGMIVPEDSACFDGRDIRRGMIPANHTGMCKFPNRDDVGYKRTLKHIERLAGLQNLGAESSPGAIEDIHYNSTFPTPLHSGLFIEGAPHESLHGSVLVRQRSTSDSLYAPFSLCETQSGLTIPTHQMPPPCHKFYGRQKELKEIDEWIHTRSTQASFTSKLSSCMVTGLGGVGKSEIVLEYAVQNKDLFDIIWWIPSSNAEELYKCYHQLGKSLCILQQESLAIQEKDLEKVVTWLSNCEFNWLLIFDNLNNHEYLAGLMPQPRKPRGTVLYTTQNSQLLAGQEQRAVSVVPFTPECGAQFLIQHLEGASNPHVDMDITAATEISVIFGGIVLFLKFAADFLLSSGRSADEFIKTYNELSPSRSNGVSAIGQIAMIDEHFDVWNYALSNLSNKAREVLSILSLLDGIAVPESFLFLQRSNDFRGHSRPEPSHLLNHTVSRDLQKYYLVGRSASTHGSEPTLSINCAVQQAVRRRMRHDADVGMRTQTAFKQAYEMLRQATPSASKYQEPELEKDLKTDSLRLDKHVSSLGLQAGIFGFCTDSKLGELLYDAGYWIWRRQSNFESGIKILKRAALFVPTDTTQQLLLKSHIYLTMGRMYSLMGPKYQKQSSELLGAALCLRENVCQSLGAYDRSLSHHILVFAAKAEVATAKFREGHPEDARKLFIDCLSDYNNWRNQQEMPFDSAKVFFGLALCSLERGDKKAAIQYADEGSAAIAKAGATDASTCHLFPRACILQQVGKFEDSVALHEDILQARKRWYGEGSVLTLQSQEMVDKLTIARQRRDNDSVP